MTGISFGTNLDSLRAQRSLSASSASFAKTSERLSSGLRINRASDDAAGLALSADLDTSARIYAQGLLNLNDGISLLSVSEGALHELANITVRQQELAAQAANGTNSAVQRNSLNQEATSLTQEYNRIVATASFNQVATLDGTLTNFRLQGGFGVDGGIGVAVNTGMLHGEYDGSTFADVLATTTATMSGKFAVSDLNGDGKDDIVNAGSGSVTIRSGDGTLFQTLSGAIGDQVRLGDINGDSILDLVNVDASSGGVAVAIGTGSGTFGAITTLNTGAIPTVADFALGDFNGTEKRILSRRQQLEPIAQSISGSETGTAHLKLR